MSNVDVKVQYFGLLKNTVGREEEQITLAKGARVEDLVNLLGQKYGEQFSSVILRADGSLRRLSRIIIDGINIRDGDGLKTKLEGDHEISLTVGINAIAGG